MPLNFTVSIVLASGSQYRKQQLEGLGITCKTVTPGIDESPKAGEKPEQLSLRLAQEKATRVARQHPTNVVIGSDQVASLDGSILGKPGTEDKATRQLKKCAGRRVTFYTSLCIISPQKTLSATDTTHAYFRQLSPEQITTYIRRENPLDCAGSFKSEGLGITLFDAIETEDPSALVGLPLISMTKMLSELGLDIITQTSL